MVHEMYSVFLILQIYFAKYFQNKKQQHITDVVSIIKDITTSSSIQLGGIETFCLLGHILIWGN